MLLVVLVFFKTGEEEVSSGEEEVKRVNICYNSSRC